MKTFLKLTAAFSLILLGREIVAAQQPVIVLKNIQAEAALVLPQDDKSRSLPDISGSWVLDTAKSKFRFGQKASAGTLTVKARDEELHISRKTTVKGQEYTRNVVYFTDGRGETNPGMLNTEIKSKTMWTGSKLVNTASITYDNLTRQRKETWELSRDGKVLTDTIVNSDHLGSDSVKYVYNRAP